jgi:predicted RNA-binding protein YlxR (DUF448 family)
MKVRFNRANRQEQIGIMVKSKQQPRRKHVPQRTCVACKEIRPKRDLVRVVLLTDGGSVVDETGKRNGRGAYLCRHHTCWEQAIKRGSLNRALRISLQSEDVAVLEAFAAKFTEPQQRDETSA